MWGINPRVYGEMNKRFFSSFSGEFVLLRNRAVGGLDNTLRDDSDGFVHDTAISLSTATVVKGLETSRTLGSSQWLLGDGQPSLIELSLTVLVELFHDRALFLFQFGLCCLDLAVVRMINLLLLLLLLLLFARLLVLLLVMAVVDLLVVMAVIHVLVVMRMVHLLVVACRPSLFFLLLSFFFFS